MYVRAASIRERVNLVRRLDACQRQRSPPLSSAILNIINTGCIANDRADSTWFWQERNTGVTVNAVAGVTTRKEREQEQWEDAAHVV